MLKILIRSLLGGIVGFVICLWFAENSSYDTGRVILWIAWGIGMGNSIRPCLRMLERTLNWAASLSIISFFSFGTGIIGLVLIVLMLSAVLSVGWLCGWVVLIRDVINEIR